MMAVGLSAEAVAPHLASAMDRAGGLITVGCVNAPTNVTITGDVQPLESLQQDLDRRGIFARRLQVNAAYHSHHMEELAEDYGFRTT
jgi:acyl transferase domain-containing protein